MKLLKKINNNFAVAADSTGQVVIVSGKGIGFEKMPGDLKDLSKISRTYYDVDERYMELIQQLPEDIVNLSIKIVDYASSKLQQKLNPNLFFTLADHMNFAIKRAKQGIHFSFGVTYEMKYLHADEMKIGEQIIKLMNKKFHVELPEDEAAVIAMHILEAKSLPLKNQNVDFDLSKLMERVCEIIQKQFHITLDKNGFNYCRFVTHVQYLLQRRYQKSKITSDNEKIYQTMVKEFPKAYECVKDIKQYFEKDLQWSISDEEMLYLMLHVNRLCNNEDCNQ